MEIDCKARTGISWCGKNVHKLMKMEIVKTRYAFKYPEKPSKPNSQQLDSQNPENNQKTRKPTKQYLKENIKHRR